MLIYYYLKSIVVNIDLTVQQQKFKQENRLGNQSIYQVVRKYPQVKWIDFTNLIPLNFMIDNQPIYVDQHHFNIYGSEQMGKRFISSHRRLLEVAPNK